MYTDYLTIFGANYLHLVIAAIALVFFATLPRERKREFLLRALLFLPLAYIIAKFGSIVYYSPRPFAAENFIPLVPHIADNGFPSDHTLLSASIALLVFLEKQSLGIALMILALFVGVSRIYAGVHSAIDIVGSFAAVAIASLLARLLLPYFKKLLRNLGLWKSEW